MGIEQFKGVMKDKAYRQWYNKSSRNILLQSVKELKTGELELSADKTSFLLTKDSIKQLAETLSGVEVSSSDLEKIRNDFLAAVPRERYTIKKDGSIVYNNVSFAYGISTILEKGLKSVVKKQIKIGDNTREAAVSDFFEKGHVFGVATNVSKQTLNNLNRTSAIPDNVKNMLTGILKDFIKQLEADDLETSNIKSLDYDIYAAYVKDGYNYVVEMQLKEGNQEAGDKVNKYLTQLRKYLKPENVSVLDKLFKTRSVNSQEDFLKHLISSKGSPSQLDIITKVVLTTIEKGVAKKLSHSSGPVKLDKLELKISRTSELKRRIAGDLAKAKTAIANLRAIQKSKTANDMLPLSSLMDIINLNLPAQVKKNMGTGNSTNVLNNRTGRLAESAELKSLTLSRNGMLSAYYTYMKYPYATFSEGGMQQYPRSRDPKLLISRSIREILSNFATNNMRAVLI